jgi:hypothetical protein
LEDSSKRDLTFTSHHTFTYSETKKKRTNIDAPLASTPTPAHTNGLCVYPPTIIRFGFQKLKKGTKFKTIDSQYPKGTRTEEERKKEIQKGNQQLTRTAKKKEERK